MTHQPKTVRAEAERLFAAYAAARVLDPRLESLEEDKFGGWIAAARASLDGRLGIAPAVTTAIADGTSQPWTPPADMAAEIERLTRAAAHHLDLETIERERRHRAEEEAEKLRGERDEARLQLQREQEQGAQARKERDAALQREGKALRERDEALKKAEEAAREAAEERGYRTRIGFRLCNVRDAGERLARDRTAENAGLFWQAIWIDRRDDDAKYLSALELAEVELREARELFWQLVGLAERAGAERDEAKSARDEALDRLEEEASRRLEIDGWRVEEKKRAEAAERLLREAVEGQHTDLTRSQQDAMREATVALLESPSVEVGGSLADLARSVVDGEAKHRKRAEAAEQALAQAQEAIATLTLERDEARESAAHDEATLRASKRASDEREGDLRRYLEETRNFLADERRAHRATERARANLSASATALHQVAQALGLPIGQDLTHPTSGVVAKVKDALAQRDSAFACGREIIKERDAMRDRMREAERQLENEKQARYNAEAGQERVRLARAERLSAKVAELQAALSIAHKRRREAESLLEHTRQNMTLVRAAADRDRYRAAGLEWTLSELRRSARAAFDGWRRGDDVGGPMFALDAMLKQIDAHEPPGLLPTPVETYRRALCFWGLVLGYEPGRQLNAWSTTCSETPVRVCRQRSAISPRATTTGSTASPWAVPIAGPCRASNA